MLRIISLALCISTVSACVSVPNVRQCYVAGVLAAGMDCAETQTDVKAELDLRESIDFLSPQRARTCVPKPGMTVCASAQEGEPVNLPERGPAVCQSAIDYEKEKNALEKACRKLGMLCTPEIQAAIARRARAVPPGPMK